MGTSLPSGCLPDPPQVTVQLFASSLFRLEYHGTLTPQSNVSGGVEAGPISMRLTVWPIAAACVGRELKAFAQQSSM